MLPLLTILTYVLLSRSIRLHFPPNYSQAGGILRTQKSSSAVGAQNYENRIYNYLHAAPDEYYYFRFKLLCCCFWSSAWTRKFTQSRWDFACATVFMYTREYMLYAVLPSIQADRRKPTSGVCKSRKKNRSFLFKIEKRQHGHDSVLLFQPIQLHQLRKKSLRRTLPTFLLKWKETPSDFTTGPGQLILTAVS